MIDPARIRCSFVPPEMSPSDFDNVPVLNEASFHRLLHSRVYSDDPRWHALDEQVKRVHVEQWICRAELALIRRPRFSYYCARCGKQHAYLGWNEGGSGGPVDCECRNESCYVREGCSKIHIPGAVFADPDPDPIIVHHAPDPGILASIERLERRLAVLDRKARAARLDAWLAPTRCGGVART